MTELKRCYNVFIDRAPCTKLHKHKQKDTTKTLVEFPNHVLKDYDCILRCDWDKDCCYLSKNGIQGKIKTNFIKQVPPDYGQ
jgi:hypothetical protein